MLNVAHACVTEAVNGPGRRFTVWVQGCPRRCPGCFNPGLQPFEPRHSVEPADLALEAQACAPVDGISLSGGEPFAQAEALSAFLDAARAAPGLGDLTAIAFTGYPWEELRGGRPEWDGLLDRLDVLVDGAYDATLAAELSLRGSSNQRLVPLTGAGERLCAQVEAAGATGALVTIAPDGEVIVAGFPPPTFLAALQRRLAPA
ncbi:MAG: radical SAM protein [Deltaproteobacteria bacterium]|nr:radical SAM protein [Deltaproteobacteria bacterium]